MTDFIRSRPGRGPALAAGVLAVIAFGLYSQSFFHAWTFDDFPVIVQNPDIRSLGNFFADAYGGRPLREVTYLVDHALFGLEPAGWHIQNIFWHTVCAFLLFKLAFDLGAGRAAAWLTSLLFLVHPLQVEVVANISHRKDSLALAFILLAVLAYRRFLQDERRRGGWLAAALLASALALLAKQNALVLPALFALAELDLPRQRRLILRRAEIGWGIAGLALALAVAWQVYAWSGPAFIEMARETLRRGNYYGEIEPLVYLGAVLKSLAWMAAKVVWPTGLAIDYLIPLPANGWDAWSWGGLGLLAALLALAVACYRAGRPAPGFACGWLLLLWIPTSGLVVPLGYLAADRYTYAPFAGLFLLAGWGVGRLVARRPGLLPPARVAAAALLGGLSLLTWQQNGVWRTEATLYAQALRVSPEATHALMGMGLALMNAGDLVGAIDHFQRASRNFNDSKPLYLLGLAHEKRGERDQAVRYFRSFVGMNETRYAREVLSVRQYLLMKYRVQM